MIFSKSLTESLSLPESSTDMSFLVESARLGMSCAHMERVEVSATPGTPPRLTSSSHPDNAPLRPAPVDQPRPGSYMPAG